jgi:hypothetical protein
MRFVFNDGGREAAGFKGKTGDCVCRSIAIVTGKPYREVYDELNAMAGERTGKRKRGKSSARTGVYKSTTKKYLAELAFQWVPTMAIGQGARYIFAPMSCPQGG